MDYFLSYVPFYSSIHKKNWVEKKLNLIKNSVNNVLIKDSNNEDMDWGVVEYYIELAYNSKFYCEECGDGLRIHPLRLLKMYDTSEKY